MSVLLTVIGAILLATCVAFVAFGVFMATSPRTRTAGKYFALCWITGAAAAAGIAMKDVVTFAVGGLFFVVALAVFLVEARRSRHLNSDRRAVRDSQRTTGENPRRSVSRRSQGRRAS